MSAWIVSKLHIDALVQGLCESERVIEDPDKVGRVLWAENLRSIQYRYPGDKDGEYPGPIDFREAHVDQYTYERPTPERVSESVGETPYYKAKDGIVTRAILLHLAECYDYQSCEHPSFKESQAFAWVDGLIKDLSQHKRDADYALAPWGI